MQRSTFEILDEKLMLQYGRELTNKIEEGYSKRRIISLRVNSIKTDIDEIKSILTKNSIKFKEVEWYRDSLIIENATENEIKKLDIYDKGEIYLQSLSSMIPALILNPNMEENILDMTAAPGGKTTQLCAISKNKALITACEKNKIRADRLKYNIEKQGANRINVLVQDARKLDDFFSFDKILLDAPCSGSGTLYVQNNEICDFFNKELIERSKKVQLELLQKAVKMLKSGGELIYSTCSILKDENEENIIKILKENEIEIVPIKKVFFDGIPLLPVKIEGTICICPDELYEGFFIAKLKKK